MIGFSSIATAAQALSPFSEYNTVLHPKEKALRGHSMAEHVPASTLNAQQQKVKHETMGRLLGFLIL